ncbi:MULTISPECIES: class I SAM-dependent methyltransferase [Acinetobacter]|uniref:class I SAM-dependent methyltransferase n=1 Tax=Acinetobacter TaxID=469 RepID=UPI0010216734|nr:MULTISPECIES: class I SAM-dependent methyltransferase [Acinetobacter]RYL26318.1 methyltransferase regulatory domain protein [Acinetobacter piscicola]
MSNTWTDGYQTEVNYTYGYYKDLSPNYQKFCLLLNGVDSPSSNEQHFHCELGFGQGVSLNIHAASNLGQFIGTDFNPAHAGHASMLAEHSQIPHQFYDASFEELLNKDLPMLDSISLHGIWSWISHENQHIILKFIRKYLKPNGIVYISYNCVTGWAANIPIRELFHSHFKFNSISNNPIQKVKDSLAFSEALLQQNPNFAKRNPNAISKIQDLQKQNPNYLIHEYLNQDWQCFSFQQVARILEEAKLTYACSTDLNTQLNSINFSEEHQQFLNKIEHPILREQCRDYFANTQFRKDLFIRGKNNLSPLEIQTRLRNTAFVLLIAPEHLPKTITGYLGEFNLIQDIYEPLGKLFKQENYAPQTIADIEKKLLDQSYAKILNALVILCHLGFAQPCQAEVSQETLQHAHQLNRFILEQASFHNNYQVLACPISGIGINADQFTQLFYRAHFIDGLKTAKQFAEYAQQVLNDLGWFIIDKGETITDKATSLTLLQEKAQLFLEQDKIKIAKQLKLFA